MFLINCPYCGERDQQEFKAGGEAHIERPKQTLMMMVSYLPMKEQEEWL